MYTSAMNSTVPPEEVMGGMFALGMGVLLIIGFICLVAYILQGVAIMKMAQNEGIPNAWLAFVPFANYWVWGELLNSRLKGNGGMKLLIIQLAIAVLSGITLGIVGFIGWIFMLVVIYWTLEKYSGNVLPLFIVTLVTGGLAFPVILFLLRNNEARF